MGGTLCLFGGVRGKPEISTVRVTHFIVLCRQIGLFTQAVAAVDGSKYRAVNTRDKNFTPVKLKKRIEQVADHIAGYLRHRSRFQAFSAPAWQTGSNSQGIFGRADLPLWAVKVTARPLGTATG